MKIARYILTALFMASTGISAMDPKALTPQYNDVDKQAVLQGNCDIKDYSLKSWLEANKPHDFNPEGIFRHIGNYLIPEKLKTQAKKQKAQAINYFRINNFINKVEREFKSGFPLTITQCCMSSLLLSGILKYTGHSEASTKLLMPAGISLTAFLAGSQNDPSFRNSNWVTRNFLLTLITPFLAGFGTALTLGSTIYPPEKNSGNRIFNLGLHALNPILAAVFGYSAYHLSGKASLLCGLLATGQIGIFGNEIKNNANTIKTYFKFKKQQQKM